MTGSGETSAQKSRCAARFSIWDKPWGSIPNLPVSSRRRAPHYEVCTWAGPAGAVTSSRHFANRIQAGERTDKEGLGLGRPPPSPRQAERPCCPSPAPGIGERRGREHRRALSSRLSPGLAGPGGTPGPRVHPPVRPSVGNPARDGASPHPPWRPRPRPRLPSGPRPRCRHPPSSAPGLPRRTCPRLRKRASHVSACLGEGPAPARALPRNFSSPQESESPAAAAAAAMSSRAWAWVRGELERS